MSTRTFTTKWDFLYATLLVGVDTTARRLFSTASASGEPLLCLWSDPDAALAALPEGYRLLSTPVRPRLAELPDGIGVVVDPDTPTGVVMDPDYARQLKRLTDPFPEGTHLTFKVWPDLPRRAVEEIRAGMGDYSFVDKVWALIYSIDDSPWIGCLAYATDAGIEGQESVVGALTRALDDSGTPVSLGVLGVQVMSVDDLQPDVRTAVLEQPTIFAAASA
jgi:hypothetical protein